MTEIDDGSDDRQHFGFDPMHNFMMLGAIVNGGLKPFVIPCIGLLVGGTMMYVGSKRNEKITTVGKLVLYFGAQSFMNIYMGWVMRTHITVPKGYSLPNGSILEVDLTGCPAGFALTAMQQVISFIVFCIFFIIAYPTQFRYQPRKLESLFEVFCVVIFGCVFALNIALNNFSLGYISIAVNLIIRSCLPLSTFLSQQGLALCKLYPFKPCRWKEITLMVIGVICAGAFTMASIFGKNSKASGGRHPSKNMILGVIMCMASLLSGSLNLALAGVLGETKLNVYDTVAYMAIPATLFLLPIAVFVEKPVPGMWPEVFGREKMTDFEILQGVWELSPNTMMWLILSGIFAFVYNIIQFSIVHTLSPSATAFGGNFNKAALIFLTLLLPFLRVHALPGSPYIQVIWCAVIINIAAFSYYGHLQIQAKMEAESTRSASSKYLNEEEEYSSDTESDTDSSSESGGKER